MINRYELAKGVILVHDPEMKNPYFVRIDERGARGFFPTIERAAAFLVEETVFCHKALIVSAPHAFDEEFEEPVYAVHVARWDGESQTIEALESMAGWGLLKAVEFAWADPVAATSAMEVA